MKQTIQTNLLGTRVVIGPVSGTTGGPFSDSAGKEGAIRNVYMEKDGSIKYSIQVLETNKLHEFYACSFRISAPDDS